MKKTRPMARPRKEPNTETYSGRFALRLRTLREKKKLTVEEFAVKSGIPKLTLYRWEQAYTTPSFNELPNLAESLGVSIRSLMPEK